MADFTVRYRPRRRWQVFHPSFNSGGGQVYAYTSEGGSAVASTQFAVRPPRTALRRMDSRGTGTVGYY